MFGELTDKETIERIDQVLEAQLHDQFEILLYKKNSKSTNKLANLYHLDSPLHLLFI